VLAHAAIPPYVYSQGLLAAFAEIFGLLFIPLRNIPL